jgi:DNA topoisomerase-3
MTIAVLAEKPSVARDLARVLGAARRGEGFLHGNGYVVTWAIGHLVTLPQPHEIEAEWRSWRWQALPMLPRRWPLQVLPESREQYEVVQRILRSEKVEKVICATDAGREGELIFRYIYEAAGCRKEVERLWLSSLTPEAIRRAFARLRPGRDFDPLAAAARGRSQADWLVGLNLSRACTLAWGLEPSDTLSVGRVQTPTLALLVERELAIRNFVPEPYFEVVAEFDAAAQPPAALYRGTYFSGNEVKNSRLPADGKLAAAIAERVRRGAARVAAVEEEIRRLPPPLLYDLTELQRHANRLFGFTAQRTLAVAQRLYEQKKLLSYPRTDSRHLSTDVAKELPAVAEALRGRYGEFFAPGTGRRSLSRRYVDDAKVSDHHAIVPTAADPAGVELDGDEEKIYDLVCRRLLMAWHGEQVSAITRVRTEVRSATPQGEPTLDKFASTGTVEIEAGWKVLDLAPAWDKKPKAKPGENADKGDEPEADTSAPLPLLREGQDVNVEGAEAVRKETRPPKPYTDASLLTAMETAGKALDDRELAEAMKENGLGTPATRAETIETLLRRQYLERERKNLRATDKGIRLVEKIHPLVKSPAMTGQWEARLRRIEKGEERLPAFLEDIEKFVIEVIGGMPPPSSGGDARRPRTESGEPEGRSPSENWDHPPLRPRRGGQGGEVPLLEGSDGQALLFRESPEIRPAFRRPPRQPTPPDQLARLLGESFGLSSFRPYQEAACRAIVEGKDVLLVMPTGAGKSLCYQLPGIARGGTTLVISPLIALMEDQVAKLRATGLRAERIHSGRDRQESRRVVDDYLAGELDFLYIAPERLGVPGFPERLARRKPALVAIDEAHCISHWGHDFRPDYRLLGQRLPELRPAPIVALTATATPLVQDDIAEQLGLAKPERFIHGFRRTNIGIEVIDTTPTERREAVMRLLKNPERRPAIVYAPTRKEADKLGDLLTGELAAAAYHAGMTAAARDKVQSAFLSGKLEVIVATIAFGMGIDKANVRTVIHTGLPASLEGYYQEIGRAGRDGLPSRALLLHSFVDLKTHEFFFDRDYPDAAILDRLFRVLDDNARELGDLARRSKLKSEIAQKALEKLWSHGGALVDFSGEARRGEAGWQKPYEAQRRHKQQQLELVRRFTDSKGCRMLHLVRHFGDKADSGQSCGLCDVCAPSASMLRTFRAPTGSELRVMERVVAELESWDGQAAGQLHRKVGEPIGYERKAFEKLLAALERAGAVRSRQDSFDKDGSTIHFQRFDLQVKAHLIDLATVATVADDGAERPAAKTKKKAHPASVKAAAKPEKAKPAAKPEKAPRPRSSGKSQGEVPELVAALKEWRLAEARRRRTPAFQILTDRTLNAIAAAKPRNEEELLEIHGIGPGIAGKHGPAILKVVEQH